MIAFVNPVLADGAVIAAQLATETIQNVIHVRAIRLARLILILVRRKTVSVSRMSKESTAIVARLISF